MFLGSWARFLAYPSRPKTRSPFPGLQARGLQTKHAASPGEAQGGIYWGRFPP